MKWEAFGIERWKFITGCVHMYDICISPGKNIHVEQENLKYMEFDLKEICMNFKKSMNEYIV